LAVAGAGGGLDLDAGSALRAAQDPVGTFRAETSVVEVGARVFDGRGQFVRDLTASDFELYEDGTLQPLTSVELIDIPPVTRAQPGAVSSECVVQRAHDNTWTVLPARDRRP
jgi:hypothetical protein